MSIETIQNPINISEAQLHEAFPRDARLTELFGTDLEFLTQNGDLDLFYIDEDRNFDGLMHTLIGDKRGGFHSESAAQILGLNHPTNAKKTMVERTHLRKKSTKEKRGFKERQFEPFAARVVIDGVKKLKTMQPNSDNNKNEVRNSMYPSEYDPTSIVRAVSTAYRNRDKDKDELKPTADGDVVVNNTGWVLMLDGVTPMKIRLVLNPDTEKIVTASPIVERSGYMNLDYEDVDQHLYGVKDTEIENK